MGASERKALVVGASGAIGRPLCARLRDLGWKVSGVHRSRQGGETLAALGCTAMTFDVFDEREVARVMDEVRPDVVFHQLTSLPKEVTPRSLARSVVVTADLRRRTGPLFARHAARVGARFVAQSMAFVTRPEGPPILDESAPLWLDGPSAIANTNDAIRVLEEATLRAEGLALRYGFFYGPGTWYAGDAKLASIMQKRLMPITGSGEGLTSFIHIDDAVDATVRASSRGASGVYNVCDDEPVTQNDWLSELARVLGAKPPRRAPAWFMGLVGGASAAFYGTSLRGASNAKAKVELGITPRSWRQGFAAEFGPARLA